MGPRRGRREDQHDAAGEEGAARDKANRGAERDPLGVGLDHVAAARRAGGRTMSLRVLVLGRGVDPKADPDADAGEPEARGDNAYHALRAASPWGLVVRWDR